MHTYLISSAHSIQHTLLPPRMTSRLIKYFEIVPLSFLWICLIFIGAARILKYSEHTISGYLIDDNIKEIDNGVQILDSNPCRDNISQTRNMARKGLPMQ